MSLQPDEAAAVDGWFAFSNLVSLFGTVFLLILLMTSLYHKKLRTGTRLLILHLMMMQLFLCAVLFPIVNTNTYNAYYRNMSDAFPQNTSDTFHRNTIDDAYHHNKFIAFHYNMSDAYHQHTSNAFYYNISDPFQQNKSDAFHQQSLPYCRILMQLYVGTMHAVNWASLLLAVNRYVATALPRVYRKLLTRKALVAMVAIPWLIGMGDTLPIYFGYGAHFVTGPKYPYCTTAMNVNSDRVYGTIVWTTLGGHMPVGLMGCVYGLLFGQLVMCRMRQSRSVVADAVASMPVPNRTTGVPVATGATFTTRNSHLRQITLTKMLIASFVWYAICFLPAPIILTVYPQLNVRYFLLPLWTGKALLLCGHAASPIIFLALSTDYQRGTRRLFQRFWTRRSTVSLDITPSGRHNSYTHTAPNHRSMPAVKELQSVHGTVGSSVKS